MKKRKEMNSYKSSWQVWEYFSSFSFTHRIYESTVGPRASRTWTTSTLALGVVLQCSPLQSAGCLTPRERSALRTKGTCPLETHSTLVDHTLDVHFLSVGPKPTYDDFYVPFLQTSVRDSCFRGVWMELGFLGCMSQVCLRGPSPCYHEWEQDGTVHILWAGGLHWSSCRVPCKYWVWVCIDKSIALLVITPTPTSITP